MDIYIVGQQADLSKHAEQWAVNLLKLVKDPFYVG